PSVAGAPSWPISITASQAQVALRIPPRRRLSDSHIVELQCGAKLDALEVIQAPAHDLGAGLAIIACPPAEASDDPGREGEGTFGMGIFLASRFALEASRKGFENGLIVGLEGVGQLPVGCTVARLDELHDGHGCYRSSATNLVMIIGSPISASSM